MTREELLERIGASKANLDAVLAAIADDAMIGPHPRGEWTGKDQLAHLTAWHQILLARIRGVREEDMLGLEPDRYAAMTMDEVNELLVRRDAGMVLEDVRAAFERTFAEIVALIEAMDASLLQIPYRPDAEGPLIDTIVGDTYEHYEEHLALLRPLATQPS